MIFFTFSLLKRGGGEFPSKVLKIILIVQIQLNSIYHPGYFCSISNVLLSKHKLILDVTVLRTLQRTEHIANKHNCDVTWHNLTQVFIFCNLFLPSTLHFFPVPPWNISVFIITSPLECCPIKTKSPFAYGTTTTLHF